jgi:hypothetical protein
MVIRGLKRKCLTAPARTSKSPTCARNPETSILLGLGSQAPYGGLVEGGMARVLLRSSSNESTGWMESVGSNWCKLEVSSVAMAGVEVPEEAGEGRCMMTWASPQASEERTTYIDLGLAESEDGRGSLDETGGGR